MILLFLFLFLFLAVILIRNVCSSSSSTLRGRAVVISGCDRGLGAALAISLSKQSVHVWALCLSINSINCQHYAQEGLTMTSSRYLHTLQVDIRDAQQLQEAVDVITNACPNGIDGLVANAAIFQSFICELTSIDTYRQVMDVNVLGTLRFLQSFLPLVRKAQGRVVLISSFLGLVSPFSLSAYAMSKHAIEALAMSLRAELAGFRVHVSLVRPSAMKTSMLSAVNDSAHTLFNNATESAKQAYGIEYLLCVPHWLRIMNILAQPVDATVRSIEHALSSRRPYAYYNIGFEAWLCAYVWPIVQMILPYEIMDGVIAWLGHLPQPAAMKAQGKTNAELQTRS